MQRLVDLEWWAIIKLAAHLFRKASETGRAKSLWDDVIEIVGDHDLADKVSWRLRLIEVSGVEHPQHVG